MCVALAANLVANVPSGPPPLTIVINGNRLPIDPAPRMQDGVLFVPVRRTLEALGLPFDRAGNRISTQVGSKSVALTVGSRVAEVDGERVTLEAPTSEIANVLYAPLRFFTTVLGAQVTFDRKRNTVNVVAQLVGRTSDGLVASAGGFERFGTVSAVDVLSDPPTLTLGYDSGPKTISIARNAIVEMLDVNADVSTPGELGDVRPGDFARVEMRKDGRVERVIDAFGSRGGRIVAVAGNQFVLDDGWVIGAGRGTEVALNGKASSFGSLLPGDVVSVRYNVESNEVREVLASRGAATAASPAGASPTAPASVRIDSVSSDASHPLRSGEAMHVQLRGTPHGSASFDIGSYVTDLAMHETGNGEYSGDYTIPSGANFDEVPLIGHLSVAGVQAPDVQAVSTISASGTPPGIVDFAPDAEASVNSNRPAIYATFAADAVPVNPSSALLWVNGRDVTADCVRTAQFIQYLPSYSYPDGPVHVTVRVSDRAGNSTTKSWSFTIRTR
ncbi:MAG: copper amine oxidase N-terminal domain-containing protein [Candidatus Eremiobacteraeota bacterium]|nr:copper amine oxidase N-terminal domain-containing protein [Candidatus Eremiobacteraeota bacterium]